MALRKDVLAKAAAREKQERERQEEIHRNVFAEPYSRSSSGPKVKHRERK